MSTVTSQKAEFGEKPLGFWASKGGTPEGWGELDDLALEPDGQGQHVTQVGPWLDVVRAAAGDERDDGSVPLGAVVSRAE